MIKLVGALLIILTTTWLGFEFAKKYSNRPKYLRQFKFALQSLNAEIMYGHLPLHEAAMRLSKQVSRPLHILFHSFSQRLQEGSQTVREAWADSLDEVWPETSLMKTEYEILLQFGETLGQHDRESQQKHILLAINHLEKEEEEARENQHRYEKMLRNLGFLSGVLIAILLL